jgi:formamidopyrimidine-DNA glycosylase
MPELPEVQTTVNGINRSAKGLKITDVWTDYRSISHIGKDNIKDNVFFLSFKKKTVGSTIAGATRRAKNILIRLSNGSTILIHMKMTGHIMYGPYSFDPKLKKDPWTPTEDGPLKDSFNKFIHLVFTLSSGKQLVLSDMRKFAKVTLIESADLEKSAHLDSIGPEPLEKEFTYTVFKTQISKRPAGKIKTVLMDQSLIAGIGNIYSDEALWRASLNPEERVKNIPDALLKKLFASIREVLLKGIDFGGDSTSDYRNLEGERGKFQGQHNVYRLTGTPCKKKDGGIIIRKIVGGRSAHFCNVHQKLLKKD